MLGDLFPQIPTFMQALQKIGYITYGIGKFHYLQTYPWSKPGGCGMDPVAGEAEIKKVVDCGLWPLYRYNFDKAEKFFSLDYKEPVLPVS